MKKLVKILFYGFLFLSLFATNDLKATHIVGGDLTYKYLGRDTFLLTLTLRRDCQLGSPEAQFDDPALISIYDGATGRLRIDLGYFGGLMIPFSKDDTLNTFIRSDCGFEGTQVCVHETKYVKKVYLPFSKTGYILAYQRCCRNSSLNNIVDPLDAGSTYFVKINGPSMNIRNSSPVFKEWPDVYICADKDLVFDHSAVDPDGDSLVYKLWNPLYGLTMRSPRLSQPFIVKPDFIPVEYLPGFGVENFMGGVPLKIDSRTGVLTARPNAVGQFLIGIEVQEYRNGVLIGSTLRDFQYNVRVCSNPPKADFSGPTISCRSLTIPFENKSTSTERFEWNFNFPDTNKIFISKEKNPTFTFPAEGVYQVRLLAVRGSDNCRDEVIKKVAVFNLNYDAKFSVSPVECKSGDSVKIRLTDISTIDRNEFFTVNRKWIVQQNNSTKVFTGERPEFKVNANQSFTVTLEVEANNGCTAQITRKIEPLEVMLSANFDVTGISCPNVDSLTLSFNDVSTYSQSRDSISSRSWIISFDGKTLERSDRSFSITLPRTDITVKLIARGGPCIDSISKTITINELFPRVSINSEVGCDGENARIRFWPSVANSALFKVQSYFWLVGGERFNNDTLTLIRNFDESVTVRLIAVLTNGCEVEASTTLNLNEFRKTADFTAIPIRCPDDDNVEYQIAYTGTSGFKSLLWSITANGVTTTSTSDRFIYRVKKNSTMAISVTAGYVGNCIRSKAQSIKVDNFAELDLVGASIDVCPLEPKRLFNSSNANLTYTWVPTTGLDLSNRLNPIVTTNVSRIYTVTASDGLCSVTRQINVNVLDSLKLDVEIMVASCNDNFVLKAKGGRGEGRYEWSTSSLFDNIVARDSVINFTITNGMQRLFVRYVGPFCNSVIKSVELTNELPQILKPTDLIYCSGDSLNVTVINLRNFQNLTFNWFDSPFIKSPLNTATVKVVTKRTDNSIIRLPFKVTNQFGCSLEDTVTILPSTRDSAFINLNVSNCDSFKVCFNVVGRFTGEYEVDFGDGSKILRNSNLPSSFCYTYAKEGQYNVKVSSLRAICGFDEIIQIVKLNKLNGDLGAKDTVTACKDVEIDLRLKEGLPTLNVIWKNAQGVQVGTGNSIRVKAENNTKYTIEATDVNGCKFTDEIVLIVLDNLPMVALPADFRACQGDTAVLPVNLIDPTIPTTVVWAPDPRIISGGNTLRPTVGIDINEQGPLVLRYTATNALGCITNGQITIVVSQRPTASIEAKVEDCGALRVCFKAVGQDLRMLKWDFGDTATNGDTSRDSDACYTYPKAGTYQVNLRSLEAFCSFIPVTKEIILYKDVDLVPNDSLKVCKGNFLTISVADAFLRFNVKWFDSSKKEIGVGSMLNYKIDKTEKLFVEGVDQNGCKHVDSFIVMAIEDFPELAISSPFTVCKGDTNALPLSVIKGNNDFTIEWDPDPRIISGLNTLNPVLAIPANASGKFILRYHITSKFGCLKSNVVEIEIKDRPKVDIAYKVENCNDFKVCFEIKGQFEKGVLWDFGLPNTTSDTSSAIQPCYIYPNEGNYKVTLTNTLGFCDFDPTFLNIQLNKVTDIIPGDTISACLRDSATLNVKETNINLRYKWTNKQGVVISSLKSFKFLVLKSETIFVTATDENGCEFKDSIFVKGINEFPQLEYVSPLPVCLGDTVHFPMVNINPNHVINILWDPSPRIIGRRDTLNPLIGIPSDVVNPFTLKFTASTQFGCTIRDSVRFVPAKPPVVDFTFAVEDCDNFKVCFKVIGDLKGFPYWNFGDTTTENDFSLQKEACYTYPGPGSYKVELTNKTNFCKFAPVVKTITLNKGLQFFDRDTQEVCKGAVASIAVPAKAQGLRFEWFDLRGNRIGNNNPLAIRVDSLTSVILRVFDVNNCPFRDTLTLKPFTFDYELKVPKVFCQDKEIEAEIIVKNNNVNFSYQWLPLNCIKRGQGTPKVMIDVKAAKNVTVVVTHPTLGCTLRDSFSIEPQRVEVNVAASPDTVIRLLKSTDIFVKNPQPGWTYEWSNGNKNVRQTVSPATNTTYTVTVTDKDGCTGTASITIKVIQPVCEEDVFIPNAFTPNNDRVNDILYVRSNYIDTMELVIYNRWGQEVFRSQNISIGWDGTFKGVTLAPDAFAYYLKAKCIDGTEIQRRGNVSLLK